MTRTYGTYAYLPVGISDGSRHPDNALPKWELRLEPAVAVRAKRLFARAQSSTAGRVLVTATPETAHDLEWLMHRFPLEPANERSATTLVAHTEEHVRLEQQIGAVLAGTHQSQALTVEPSRPARDYQRAAVDLLRTTRSLLLTDEVGLGKTFTGLLALAHDDALPAVIVPPTHLPSRWITELQESFPTLTFDLARTTKVTAQFEHGQKMPDVLIVPYSRLAGWAHHLQGWARTIVFDEVQDLRRGVTSQKGSAAKMIADAATYKLGLTATPVYNYGGEIWQLLNILAPGVLGTYDEFAREWGGTWGRHLTVKQPATLGNYLREQGVMLGRTRKEVGRELPKTVKVPQFIDADAQALEAVAGDAAAMARMILSDTSSRQDKFQAAGELDWKLREATGIAKAPYVAEFVRLLLESEEKVVLFGWHRAVYDVWNEMLAEFNPVMYTGSESPKQKDAAQEAFVDGDARVLIMSLRSGAGVDGLQKASSVAVFGELDWSPQVHEQAIGRLRRDGMGEEPPVAYFLNSTEGSDPALMEALQVKRNQAEPLVSRDGKLLTNAVQDTTRARALAEHVLALASKGAESRGQLDVEAVA